MTKHILFIHGAGGDAHTLDSKLADSLQRVLGTTYDVHVPKMPKPNDPKDALWREEIKRQLAKIDDPVILAGHSLGASTLLKFLSEETVKHPIDGLFLAATPFWDMDEYKLREDFADHLPKDLPIFFYQCKDDDSVPPIISRCTLRSCPKRQYARLMKVDTNSMMISRQWREIFKV